MYLLVELHGQPGWGRYLTPSSVDEMIFAAPTTLLAVAEADDVDVDVSEPPERIAGRLPVLVERSEHYLTQMLGGDAADEREAMAVAAPPRPQSDAQARE
jgi:hypothetical protein